jgi:lysophospholipase L1-like esterase
MKSSLSLPQSFAWLCAALLLALPRFVFADADTNAPASSGASTNTVMEDHPVEDAAKFKLKEKADPSLPTLYLVGDSTMKNGTPGQEGWGDEMAPFFDAHKINVVNEAIGGRSSRTFQSEGRWDAVLALVQKGDYVVIQFGHNDSGAVNDNFRARASLHGVGEETQEIDNILTKKHEVVHTFGWYMRKYVTDVQAKGATPIVMSLVPRNSWKDGKVVRASGDTFGGWAQQAATATNAIYVDDNEIIAEALDALGQTQALPLFADGKLHSSHDGAILNAKSAVAGLKGIPGNPLASYFSPDADAIPAFTGPGKTASTTATP